MTKPLIGVTPLYDRERDSLWMIPGYMDGIEAAGGIPVMLPLTTDADIIHRLAEEYDGFLFTGGQDVSPSLYGAEPSPECGIPCPARDEMERLLLDEILMFDKPLLGICRGIQFLNAALGGTLYQDLPSERPSHVGHEMTPPYDRTVHTVSITGDTPLSSLLGVVTLGVNSYHHQAVKELAPPLVEMAVSEDGLTEAVYMPGKKFIWAIQWHPELSYKVSDSCAAIFKAFVDASASA